VLRNEDLTHFFPVFQEDHRDVQVPYGVAAEGITLSLHILSIEKSRNRKLLFHS